MICNNYMNSNTMDIDAPTCMMVFSVWGLIEPNKYCTLHESSYSSCGSILWLVIISVYDPLCLHVIIAYFQSIELLIIAKGGVAAYTRHWIEDA